MSRRRWPAAALLVASLAGCGGGTGAKAAAGPSAHLTGWVSLPGFSPTFGRAVEGQPCVAQSGYSDLTAGATVTVKDGDGHVIATGPLSQGVFSKDGNAVYDTVGHTENYGPCRETFAVAAPSTAKFYVLTVGHRGEQTYSRDDLAHRGWHVDLSVGP